MTTPVDVASAAQALAESVSACAASPADAIRVLVSMAATIATTPTTSSPIGKSMAVAQAAMGDAMRRAAVISMARASALHQPSSVSDAAAVRATVCAALDAEIVIAGDQHEDATYSALRTLRAAVSADLTRRGAGLPSVGVVLSNASMPALALAQREYRDAARSDGLVSQADAIHPAFMPMRFKALSM